MLAIFYLTTVSVIWALSFGLIGNILHELDPLLIASTRLGLGLLVFLPFLRLGQLKGCDLFRLTLCGAIQFGLMYLCYIQAYRFLPSHLVALFSILTPLYVVLIYDLKARRWTPFYLAAAALSVLGAAIIQAKGINTSSIWTGFALMQVAGLAFAYGQIDYRNWKQKNSAIKDHSIFALLCAGGFALSLLALLYARDGTAPAPNPQQWLVLAYLGIIATGGGFFLWNKAAALTNPGTLAAFNNAVVPLGMFSSLVLFGEGATLQADTLLRLLIGSILIISAVILASRRASAVTAAK